MLSRNKIKTLNALLDKKGRKEQKAFIVEGNKIVKETFKSDYTVKDVFATKAWIHQNSIIQKSFNLEEVTEDEMKKISSLTTPQPVLAVIEVKHQKLELERIGEEAVLVLDEIKDPGNLGTIIRIADWFGIQNIVCSESCVELYNPKVVQATMGSFLRVNVFFNNVIDFLTEYKTAFSSNYIYGASLDGENLYNQPLNKRCLIVMGNESKGISSDVIKVCTHLIKIPSFSSFDKGSVSAESLNVGVATAIICSELRRNNS